MRYFFTMDVLIILMTEIMLGEVYNLELESEIINSCKFLRLIMLLKLYVVITMWNMERNSYKRKERNYQLHEGYCETLSFD